MRLEPHTGAYYVLVFKQLVNKTPCKFCLPRPDFQYGHVFASRNFSALTTNQGNIHSHHDDTEETVRPTLTEVLGVCFPERPLPILVVVGLMVKTSHPQNRSGSGNSLP